MNAVSLYTAEQKMLCLYAGTSFAIRYINCSVLSSNDAKVEGVGLPLILRHAFDREMTMKDDGQPSRKAELIEVKRHY